jgi:hypothetical protein
MHIHLASLLLSVPLPPAAKTLAVVTLIYGLVQGIKKIPVLTPYITGWVAVALNLVLQVCGFFVTIPADQLYTSNTLTLIINGLVLPYLASAGIHGTIKSFSQPQVLAQTPPDGKVREVDATLVPNDPENVAVAAKNGPAAPLVMLLACCAALSIAGCVHAGAGAPPATAPSIYQQGAQYMNDFSVDLAQAQGIEITLYTSGAIDVATHKAIEGQFSAVAGYGIQIDQLIASQASAPSILAQVNAAIGSLTAISTSAAKLDAKTLAQVNGYVAILKQLLTNLLPIFAPGVSPAAPSPSTAEVNLGPSTDRNTSRAGRGIGLANLQPGQGRAGGEGWYLDSYADLHAYL